MTVHAVEVCASPSGRIWQIKSTEHIDHDGRAVYSLTFARTEGDGKKLGSVIVLPDAGLQVRAAANEDICCAVMRGFDDYPFAVFSDGRVLKLGGKVAGNYATIIEADPQDESFIIGLLRSATRWERIRLQPDTRITKSELLPVPDAPNEPNPGSGSSHGFLDLIDGEPHWDHVDSPTVIAGISFHHPLIREQFTIGMHGDPNWILVEDIIQNGLYYLPGTETAQLPPRAAVDADGTLHLAVSVGGGIFATAADLRPYTVPAPASPTTPVPPPTPPPPAEEFVMPRALQDIKQFVLSHPLSLQILGTPAGGGQEDARRRNCFRFVNQVVWDLQQAGATHVGLLENPNHTNVIGYSADNIAVKTGPNTILHFDIVSASEAESAAVSWQDNGPIDPDNGQAWAMPVEGWLVQGPDDGTEPETPETPETPAPGGAGSPPGPPPTDLELGRQILEAILQVQARQEARIERVEALAELARTRLEAVQLGIDNLNANVAALTEAVAAVDGANGYEGYADIKFLGRARVDLTPKS